MNKMSLTNKVAIITGAATGIGRATAIFFAQEGANVVIVDKDRDKLQQVLEECKKHGKKYLAITADLSQHKEVSLIVQKAISEMDKLDILVNNAGIMRYGSILDGTILDTYDELMNVNLRSAIHLTTTAAPHLAKTKGNIINIGSIGAFHKPQFLENTTYCVTKAAINHFTRCAALELAPSGIRVNCVNPGSINTEILVHSGWTKTASDEAKKDLVNTTPLKKIAAPEEVAELIAYLTSDKAKSITGSCYLIDNGACLVN